MQLPIARQTVCRMFKSKKVFDSTKYQNRLRSVYIRKHYDAFDQTLNELQFIKGLLVVVYFVYTPIGIHCR